MVKLQSLAQKSLHRYVPMDSPEINGYTFQGEVPVRLELRTKNVVYCPYCIEEKFRPEPASRTSRIGLELDQIVKATEEDIR